MEILEISALVLSEINVRMHNPMVKYYVNKKRLLRMLMGIINVLLSEKPDILCNDFLKKYYMSFVERKIFLHYFHANNESNTKKRAMLCLQ